MSNIFCQSDLWKIELIEPGLAPNPFLQKNRNRYGFFDKVAPIYMPLAVYYGTDKVNECLPQGTLLEWRDKCISMFENRLKYNTYIKMYNNVLINNKEGYVSIESDAKTLTLKEFQKKYEYNHIDIWIESNKFESIEDSSGKRNREIDFINKE